MASPKVTRSVGSRSTFQITEYPCPCGRGTIDVSDITLHSTRSTPEEDLDQEVIPCPACGNDDAEAAAELLAGEED